MKKQRALFKDAVPPHVYKQLQALNKPNRWLDGFTIAGTFLIFLLLFVTAPRLSQHLWLYLPYLFIQGFTIHCIGQLWHDYGTHNQFIMPKLRYVIAFLLPISPTQYKHNHYLHHLVMPNTDEDPDAKHNQPKGFFRKIIALTCLHTLFIVLFSKKSLRKHQISNEERKKIRRELPCFYIAAIISIALACLGIHILLLGWLLPTLIGTAFWNGLRVFAEHSETHPDKAFGTGNSLKLPLWMKLTPYVIVFGEGHIVHHYFPRIPWYHCAKAAKIVRPYLEKEDASKPFFKNFFGWLFLRQRQQ